MPDALFSDVNVLGVLIATLGGAAIGLERQWSGHADGEDARFAGIRTFTLLGALGGICGGLWAAGLAAVSAVLLAGGVGLTVVAYAVASRRDIEATTEVAALVVLAAGVLAGLGAFTLSSGIIALEALLLAEKSRLHAAVQGIDDVGLRAGIRFAALALIVLPLLPAGPYGPLGGVRPRELWALTLFFCGLSFLGYVARRVVGPGRGYFVTGLLGGLLSSTNTTFTFARLSRKDEAHAHALAMGTIAANVVLYPRVLVATAVLNPSLVGVLLPFLVPPAAVAVAVAVFAIRQPGRTHAAAAESGNPLQLGAALRVAAIFQAVLMLVNAAGGVWGDAGILGSAAVLGLTDVDALTTSMARSVAHSASVELAAAAIATGVLSNTLMKCGLAMGLGNGRFRVLAGGTLLAMAAASVIAITVLRGWTD